MGAVDAGGVVTRGPIVDLIAQVNRFTRRGEFGGKSYPLEVASGNLTPEVARAAIIIHQTRLITAQMAIPDAGTALAIKNTSAALADPVNYVAANLAMLTGSIAGYADVRGMPPPDYPASGGEPASGISTTMLVIGVGAIALVWVLSKRKR